METVTNGASPKKSKKRDSEKGVKRKAEPQVTTKKKSKKKQANDESQLDVAIDEHIVISSDAEANAGSSVKKSSPKKRRQLQDETVSPAESISQFVEADLTNLIKKISEQIPENDTMMFKLRARNIDWEKIAFKSYSSKLCRDVWYMIQGQLRHNRTLEELLSDAREWANTEWKENLKPKIHPDFPKRPLTTAYLLYFSEAKNHILSIKPNLDHVTINRLAKKVFATIEPEKIEYYEKVAAENKKKYEEAVEAFYNYKPDLRKKQMQEKVRVQSKPCTPFALFAQEQMLRVSHDLDKTVIKEALKEEWKLMDNKAKLPYIDMALELQKKCIEDAEPGEKPKMVLSKEELKIKEEMMGKPQKPPGSAYMLFSQTMFRCNEELKVIPYTEKMKKVGSMWKELPESEKIDYKKQLNLSITEYRKQYEEYKRNISNDTMIEYYQEDAKKSKQKKTKEPELSHQVTVANTTISEKESANMLNKIIPETWMDMTADQRTAYLDIIKEVRTMFDKNMQKCKNTSVEIHSDGESSENDDDINQSADEDDDEVKEISDSDSD